MDGAVLRLFADLDRQGPGCDRDTLAVLAEAKPLLAAAPFVVDFGCGTGRSSLALAGALPSATVAAVDAVPIFIARLREAARQRGLERRLRAEIGDMLRPPMAAGSVDLIWSEGAAYSVGLGAALRSWRPLLRSGGICVLSECEWLSDDRPADVAAFWSDAYPDMQDRAGNTRLIRAEGFDILHVRLLADEGWDAYHGALIRALRTVAVPSGIEPDFRSGIEREIEIRRLGRTCFGYSFYVLRPSS